MNIYSPRVFGKMVGRSVPTLQRWDRDGILKAQRSKTNRRYYTHDDYLACIGQKATEKKTIAYCRVSSAAQKPDLLSQKRAVEQYCIASGREISSLIEDIGSGLNYKRKGFTQIMEQVEQGAISEIVIAHRDRLVRFGYEWFEQFCVRHGCRIAVMNAESLSPEAEMTKDLLSIVHCFSSRLYGLRKYKQKIANMAKEQPA